MDNFDRGDAAMRAMEAYGLPEEGIGNGYPIADLIANLCHLARRHDLNVEDIVTRGLAHFGSDVIEQAWQHSETGWHNTLQDPSNIKPAIEVMKTAGVPEIIYEKSLAFCGLIPFEAEEE